jgi:hypothetical protein
VAVTFLTGFEARITTADGFSLVGTASYNTATVRTGAASVRCNPASGAQGHLANFVLGGEPANYTHFALNVASLPSVTRLIAGAISAGFINVRLTSAGALAVYLNTTLIDTSAAAFASPGWHWVGIRQVTGTSVAFLQIDGSDAVTGTATVTGTTDGIGFSGTEASAVDAYVDDVIFDSAGFLGPSKVALLLPISDNARATLWTGGSGGTTNLYDAVNNTPPIGTATETNLTQIEHAGGSGGTTDAYDANMTTYTTAGVGASDTVLALQGIVVWGEDVATGTKRLSYSGVSNPAWTGEDAIDVSTGDGSMALGTYGVTGPPDGWNERRSAVVTSPSVTLGTSPVMRVLRPETASRVASVCFMGIYVAWTPATGVPSSQSVVIA